MARQPETARPTKREKRTTRRRYNGVALSREPRAMTFGTWLYVWSGSAAAAPC
jgi:hypothetical protein